MVEAIDKYTNLDPASPERVTILNMHVISQWAPDIHQKLTKMSLSPRTPTQCLLEVATGVFNNRDMALRQGKDQRAKLQGKIQAQIMAAAIVDSPRHQTNQEQKKRPVSGRALGKSPCYKCGQIRHWTRECPNKRSLLGPCPVCKETGHWKRDCPHLQRERKTRIHFPTQASKMTRP